MISLRDPLPIQRPLGREVAGRTDVGRTDRRTDGAPFSLDFSLSLSLSVYLISFVSFEVYNGQAAAKRKAKAAWARG